jgi:outer membrane protein TolC
MEIKFEAGTNRDLTLARRSARLAVAQARCDEGLGPAFDLMTANSDRGSAAADIEQARIKLVQSWILLENAIGR